MHTIRQNVLECASLGHVSSGFWVLIGFITKLIDKHQMNRPLTTARGSSLPHLADSQSKPHIAIVCDTAPYPTRSGDNQRIAELIRVLRQGDWYVHLVLCGFTDRRGRELCRRNFDALHVFPGSGLRVHLRNFARRTVRFIDRGGARFGLPPLEEIARRLLGRPLTPLVIDYWERYPKGLSQFVAKLGRRFLWKALIVEYIWLHPAIDDLDSNISRLLDSHDLQHKRVEEFESRGMSFPLKITREEESRIFARFDAVIGIQATEAGVIKAMCPQVRVLTVGSSGAGGSDLSPRVIPARLLYVGGYNGANVDGLRRFLTSIWPEIIRQDPKAHLRVCGYVHRDFSRELFPNVTFLGYRESVEAEYAEAAVVINPAWIGTGLKIKSVEALARGVMRSMRSPEVMFEIAAEANLIWELSRLLRRRPHVEQRHGYGETQRD